ncbi:UTP--glucose-1-phosphate uridylyltransferase GalU [Haliangium sp.]|uniref:UTP--glucose-1-phosphate uridylyltransferase GalU n=1 Tax=Haliangium sp. TaxID=2663208 RepID=UPI003D0FCF8A
MSRGSIRKAVIPAAGLGTRFLPATKAIPKEMLPIVDVPTIQLVIEEAVGAGVEDIVIINGRYKVAIEDHFDHAFEIEHTLEQRGKQDLYERVHRVSSMARLISVRQKQPLGLGHAVACARAVVGDEPFAVLLGDDLIENDAEPGIGQLCEVYEKTGAGVVGIMEVAPGEEKLYGIVDAEPIGDGMLKVRDMVEKPDPSVAPSRLAVIGRYVLPPAIWPLLDAVTPGVGGEIQLTDALRELARQPDGPGLIAVPIRGHRHDAGNKVGFLRANLSYALKRPELRGPILAMMREVLSEAGATDAGES